MKAIVRSTTVCLIMLGCTIGAARAGTPPTVSAACDTPSMRALKENQSQRLFHPDAEVLDLEAAGKVLIYNCFTDREIDAFFRKYPGRILNAHFYPILVRNPETGELTDEGC